MIGALLYALSCATSALVVGLGVVLAIFGCSIALLRVFDRRKK